MLTLIVLAVFVVMIGIIWFHEGWKKGLKIIGLFLLSALTLGIMQQIFGIKEMTTFSDVLNLSLWGIWIIGLIIYNIKEGYIGNI